MIKRKKIIIGLIVLAAVGVLASLGWAGRQIAEKKSKSDTSKIEKQPSQPETSTTTNESLPTTTEATTTDAIDTSNWVTYKNEEYGFEIKYPFYLPKVHPQVIEIKRKNNNEVKVRIRLPFSLFSEFSEDEERYLLKWKELIIIAKEIEPNRSSEFSIMSELAPPQEMVYVGLPKIIYVGDVKFKKEEGIDSGMGHSEEYIIYSTIRENQSISIGLMLEIVTHYPASEASFFEKQIREITIEEPKILIPILSTFKFTK